MVYFILVSLFWDGGMLYPTAVTTEVRSVGGDDTASGTSLVDRSWYRWKTGIFETPPSDNDPLIRYEDKEGRATKPHFKDLIAKKRERQDKNC